MTRRLIVLLATATLGLGGCVSLFPKAPPVQLYRFAGGATAQPSAPLSVSGPSFNLLRATSQFDQASQGDGILTARGDEAAYIAGARWAAPAVVLFDEALDEAIDAAGGPARRVERGGLANTQVELKLDVQTFEASYLGDGAAPTVIVRAHAVLLELRTRRLLDARTFEARSPAAADRVSAIVAAFSAAVGDLQGQIVAWTEAQGATVAAAGAP